MITHYQIKAGRNLLGWSQQELSRQSRLSIQAVARLELPGGNLGGYAGLYDKVVATLEAAGVEFLAAAGPGEFVRRLADTAPQPSVGKQH